MEEINLLDYKTVFYRQDLLDKPGIGLNKVCTPYSIISRMVEISGPKSTERILVLYNIEIVEYLTKSCQIPPSQITYITDCKFRSAVAASRNGVASLLINSYKEIKEKCKDMKFDLIISNPPYNNNLDLKILKDVYELSDRICFVHPAGWLYDKKDCNSLYIEMKRLLNSKFVSAEPFNGNPIFTIGLFIDCAITYFANNSDNRLSIDAIDSHGNSKIYFDLKDKILNYCNNSNCYTYAFYSDKKNSVNINQLDWQFGHSPIRGSHSRPDGSVSDAAILSDFYTIVSKQKDNTHVGLTTQYNCKYFFDTENEALNFKNYLKTKIARFCLSIFKISQNINSKEFKSVPYLPTYTRPWSDEDVAKELGLTDEELAWAINWIPDYYPEDKEKYEKLLKGLKC